MKSNERVVIIPDGYEVVRDIIMVPPPILSLKDVDYIVGYAIKKRQTFDKCKIWLGNNPGLSEAVQKELFRLGYEWLSGDTEIRTAGALYLRNNYITMSDIKSYFDQHTYREITPEDLGIDKSKYEIKPNIEVGKWYTHFGIPYVCTFDGKWAEIVEKPKLKLGEYDVEIVKEADAQQGLQYYVKTKRGKVSIIKWLNWYNMYIDNPSYRITGITEYECHLDTYLCVLHPNNKADNTIGCINNISWEQIETVTDEIKRLTK